MAITIIAGIYKGRKIECPAGVPTRPLLAIAKKSLFDILTPVILGSKFLDLFAGVGSVGIEALSRGAKKAVFIENNMRCVKSIEETLFRIGSINNASVIPCDASGKLPLNEKFDIIFIGPPYKMKQLDAQIANSSCYLEENGILIGQHHFKEILPDSIGNLECFRQKQYGDMRLSFYKKGKKK